MSHGNGRDFAQGSAQFHNGRADISREKQSPIDTSDFDFDSLDSLEDRARQHLLDGGKLMDFIAAIREQERRKDRCEGFNIALTMIAESRTPGYTAKLMMFLTGINYLLGKSLPQIARAQGESKQTAHEKIERMRADLDSGWLVLSNVRDASARENMRRSNYRHPNECELSR